MPLPIDLEKDTAVGISLPLQSGRGGYFNQTYTTIEQVTSNVINLLLTLPGERYMQPNPNIENRTVNCIENRIDNHIENNIEHRIEIESKRAQIRNKGVI